MGSRGEIPPSDSEVWSAWRNFCLLELSIGDYEDRRFSFSLVCFGRLDRAPRWWRYPYPSVLTAWRPSRLWIGHRCGLGWWQYGGFVSTYPRACIAVHSGGRVLGPMICNLKHWIRCLQNALAWGKLGREDWGWYGDFISIWSMRHDAPPQVAYVRRAVIFCNKRAAAACEEVFGVASLRSGFTQHCFGWRLLPERMAGLHLCGARMLLVSPQRHSQD